MVCTKMKCGLQTKGANREKESGVGKQKWQGGQIRCARCAEQKEQIRRYLDIYIRSLASSPFRTVPIVM